MKQLPRVMVLEYQPELTHSVWIDYRHRCRTQSGLDRQLRQELRSGRFVGYRLIELHKEIIGYPQGILLKSKNTHHAI